MKFAPGAWDRLKNMRTWRKVHGAWCSHFSARCLLSLRACRRRDEADTRLTGCRESNRVTKTDRCQDATAEQDQVGVRVTGSSSEGLQPCPTRWFANSIQQRFVRLSDADRAVSSDSCSEFGLALHGHVPLRIGRQSVPVKSAVGRFGLGNWVRVEGGMARNLKPSRCYSDRAKFSGVAAALNDSPDRISVPASPSSA